MTQLCLDCGVRQPDVRGWCVACGSVCLELAPPVLVPVCPECAKHWPMRWDIAKQQGTPVSLLCAVHFAELRQDAATRMEVFA